MAEGTRHVLECEPSAKKRKLVSVLDMQRSGASTRSPSVVPIPVNLAETFKDAVIDWVIEDSIPFHMIEGPAFRHMLALVSPGLTETLLPKSANTIKAWVEERFAGQADQIRERITANYWTFPSLQNPDPSKRVPVADVLSPEDWHILKEVKAQLEPFEVITKRFEYRKPLFCESFLIDGLPMHRLARVLPRHREKSSLQSRPQHQDERNERTGRLPAYGITKPVFLADPGPAQ
ncbi:hypothetical protein B0T26DRAFT_676805 [Lasiosphaeria miniovina]|uniref:Uncharacterized protein n=1 Tax=Lasiosphaeria miniovina TaxID=1954250 RepID=A0AA40DZG2_9PEZI|nr:uncharacterized protein B0T26DRAFT_676805 [Lasiosphaeria miniovina]KAK0718671.1 hypothetical protein B0T26DRAFT_676805 [Lasiosphaeria miniovina]